MAIKRITDLDAAGALTGDEAVELSKLSATIRISGITISAMASDNSYNDSASGFIAAGFAIGDRVNVTGFTGDVANNIRVGTITDLTTAKMTIGGTDGDVIVDDAAGETVVIAKWESARTTTQDIADLGGGGGSAEYPDFTGNAGKVLAVNGTEDDVEWIEMVAAAGGTGGGKGAVSVHDVIDLIAVTGVEIKELDFANYDYEFRFSARGTGRSGDCNLLIQTGDTAETPAWNTASSTFVNHTGAVAGSVSGGQVRVGYSGTVAENEPIVAKVEMRTTDDRKTMNAFYFYGPYEGRGVIAQNVDTAIGSVRFLLNNGVWTGTITVVKTARGFVGSQGGDSPNSGALNPIDYRPESPDTWNDEFDGDDLSAEWAWVNQTSGGATASYEVKNSQLRISQNTPVGGQNTRLLVRDLPAGNFDIITKCGFSNAFVRDYMGGGLALRNPTSGVFDVVKMQARAAGICFSGWIRWNSPTSGASETNFQIPGQILYLRIRNDGTNVRFYSSLDGAYWTLCKSYTVAEMAGFTQIALIQSCENTQEIPQVTYEWLRNYDGGYVEPDIAVDETAPVTTRLDPPRVADFPDARNISGTTITASNKGYGLLLGQTADPGFASRGFTQAAPATPWTCYMLIDFSLVDYSDNCRVGIMVYNSGNTRSHSYGAFMRANGVAFGQSRFDGPGSFNGDAVGNNYSACGPRAWLRLENDGTNLIFSFASEDADEWLTAVSTTLAAHIGAITDIGVHFQANSVDKLKVLSFGFTDPLG